MTANERYLYHQIHPLKLLTDFGAGFGSLYPFWRHQLAAAFIILLVPPMVASLLILRFADLKGLKDSSFGAYVDRYMTRAVEAIRLIGMIIMAAGAWLHLVALIIVGLAVILLAWGRGIFWPIGER